MKAWIDGKFIDLKDAVVPILSFSFSRGVAPFEVAKIVLTENGPAIFAHKDHLDRFFNSVRLMYMELPYSHEEITEAIKETIKVNNVSEGVLKYYAYFPQVEFKMIPIDHTPSVAVFAVGYEQAGSDPAKVNQPVRIGVTKYKKLHPDTIPIQAKVTGNYIGSYLSKTEMSRKGLDGLLQLSTDGYVAESTTLSAFFVKNGVIYTPPLTRALEGTTRKVVISVAEENGIELIQQDIRAEELVEFDEAFLTSSTVGVQPVASIEGVNLKDGAPGPITKIISDGILDIYSGKSPESHRWLTFVQS